MKIAVIAADGRSGQALVQAALAAGYSVRAGYRRQNKFAKHPNLQPVKCNATSDSDLKNLLQGCDAVVSLIGHVKGSSANVQTVAMQKLITAMKATGQKRLVSLTGTGVRLAGDKITLVDRFLNLGVNTFDPNRVKDGKAAAALLQASGLDWTLIRVLKLQNISPKPYVLRANGPTKTYVGRQEVAQAILEVLKAKSFIKQAPIIGS